MIELQFTVNHVVVMFEIQELAWDAWPKQFQECMKACLSNR
jgi:hypothetical protein